MYSFAAKGLHWRWSAVADPESFVEGEGAGAAKSELSHYQFKIKAETFFPDQLF